MDLMSELCRPRGPDRQPWSGCPRDKWRGSESCGGCRFIPANRSRGAQLDHWRLAFLFSPAFALRE